MKGMGTDNWGRWIEGARIALLQLLIAEVVVDFRSRDWFWVLLCLLASLM